MNIAPWQMFADELGFDNEVEMLTTLYRSWTMECIAHLLGVATSTIFNRLRKHKIPTRPYGSWRGGPR